MERGGGGRNADARNGSVASVLFSSSFFRFPLGFFSFEDGTQMPETKEC